MKTYTGHRSNSRIIEKKTSRRGSIMAKYGSPIKESPLVELRKKVGLIEPNNIAEKA